jgi:hypothetical protein
MLNLRAEDISIFAVLLENQFDILCHLLFKTNASLQFQGYGRMFFRVMVSPVLFGVLLGFLIVVLCWELRSLNATFPC